MESTQSVDISEKEFLKFSRLIYEKAGINLGLHKKELLKNRLRKRLRELGIDSFGNYYRYVTEHDKSGREMSNMLTAISTNVTFFFREENHFTFLREVALPEILARKKAANSKSINAWSAGCSSGEEAYSLAICLSDYLKGEGAWDVSITATDISTEAIAKAERGIYKIESTKNVPPNLLKENFKRGVGKCEGLVKIKNHIKSMIEIKYLNLKDASFSFEKAFDMIFCRNVLIYFDRLTQQELLAKFEKHIVPGGYLFLGHSEGLTGRHTGFKHLAPSVYVRT